MSKSCGRCRWNRPSFIQFVWAVVGHKHRRWIVFNPALFCVSWCALLTESESDVDLDM